MRSQKDSIKYGYKKYNKVYQDAVSNLWTHEKVIFNIPIEYWLMAQIVQESRFYTTLTSPVGAGGLAQFMPNTAKEVGAALFKKEVFTEEFNVFNDGQSAFAHVYYMNSLYAQWTAKRSKFSRFELALASYNAGLGNILTAQKKSNNSRHWFDIKNGLKRVTGKKNSKETIRYVSNITKFALIFEDYKI